MKSLLREPLLHFLLLAAGKLNAVSLCTGGYYASFTGLTPQDHPGERVHEHSLYQPAQRSRAVSRIVSQIREFFARGFGDVE